MHRYARYWGEDDELDHHERRGYGERGGHEHGRRPLRRRELRDDEPPPSWPYGRGWREPYGRGWREPPPPYRGGDYGERPVYGRGPRDDARWRGAELGPRRGWGERAPYAYGRPPMMHGPPREPRTRGRWEERPPWRGEPPGIMARSGEGARPFFQLGHEPGPHAGKGPKGYRRSDDRIREDVCERIATWGWVDASEVEVRVQDAEVTLSGHVGSRRDKRLLEDMIEGVLGVIDVHNRVRVRQSGRGARPERSDGDRSV